jgi:two-component system chemotaxis response regulator CheY
MKKNILIVDDSESIRELVCLTLESNGYKVAKAIDAEDALTLLDGRDFNLMITDLNMPNMDGLQLIRKVRELNDYSTMPILFLTTETDLAKKEEAKTVGATGWIVKPFKAEKLLEIIKKVIR